MTKFKIRRGTTLDDSSAHRNDHQKWNRRSFLQTLGLAGGGTMLLGSHTVQAMNLGFLSSALNPENDRILVIIRQKGGNDGLNTVVPVFDYATYQSKRPNISIPSNKLLNLNSKFSLPDTMGGVKTLWDSGQMKVINSVGYPDQNLSHFRSTDIWDSASDATDLDKSGWMGRMLDHCFPDFSTSPPDYPPAIQIGSSGSILFNNQAEQNLAFSVANPELLFQLATSGELYDTVMVPDCHHGEQLRYIRTVTNQTFKYAELIKEAYDQSSNQANYGNNGQLANSLALVARLIKGGLPTQVYMVTLGGHDTHANQNQLHPNLMAQLSNSVAGFYEDLTLGSKDEKVVCLTVSEFGRRIEQNASRGTDHGAAAPVLLFGQGLNGNGVLGKDPDLNNTDSVGNLIYGTDFRQIYATLLEYWLCMDSTLVDQLLGKSFGRLPELGLTCENISPVRNAHIDGLVHEARYARDGSIRIYLYLPYTTQIQLDLFTIQGKKVSTLLSENQGMGERTIDLSFIRGQLAQGLYVYRLQANGQSWSKKIVVH